MLAIHNRDQNTLGNFTNRQAIKQPIAKQSGVRPFDVATRKPLQGVPLTLALNTPTRVYISGQDGDDNTPGHSEKGKDISSVALSPEDKENIDPVRLDRMALLKNPTILQFGGTQRRLRASEALLREPLPLGANGSRWQCSPPPSPPPR